MTSTSGAGQTARDMTEEFGVAARLLPVPSMQALPVRGLNQISNDSLD